MKKTVIVYTDKPLTKKQRRSFEKDHPGYRLCFRLRYPNFPLLISVISLLLVIASGVLRGILR